MVRWQGAIALAAVAVGGLLLGVRLGPSTESTRLPAEIAGTAETPGTVARATPAFAVDPLDAWKLHAQGVKLARTSAGAGYLFPVGDPAALVQPSSSKLTDAVINQWVQANQGTDARTTTVRLSVSGLGLVLTDLRVVDLRCTQPTAALRVNVVPRPKPKGDRLMKIRLDDDPTRVTRAWSFPLTVPDDEPEVIVVSAGVRERACEWRLLLQYTKHGTPGFAEIMNGAQPFRTAPGPGDGHADWTTADGLAFTRQREAGAG